MAANKAFQNEIAEIKNVQNELVSDFAFFDNWQDRYRYIIDLGKQLPTFPPEFQIDDYKVEGCQSQVWFYPTYDGNKLHVEAMSDSAIVSGLIAILLKIYNDHTPQAILTTSPEFISRLALDKHLSPTRSNGLYAMLKKIQAYAKGYAWHIHLSH